MLDNLSHEYLRLNALTSLEILDTEPEAAFDNLIRLAASVFQTSMCAVSLIDEDRQWFKARLGLSVAKTSRSIAFCDHTIRFNEGLVVLDATQDARFCSNPLVIASPSIRFYAGARIMHAGYAVGAFCVMDAMRRSAFSPTDQYRLRLFADLASALLEQRKDVWPQSQRLVYLD